MPHRDPETGQFVSQPTSHFDDLEVVTFTAGVGVEASNLGGGTTFSGAQESFEGLEIIDYDEVVDRNESLHLLRADHVLSVFANSTATADGTVAASIGISTSPARATDVTLVRASTSSFDDSNAVGGAGQDDTIDLIGRPLAATAGAPFSDGSTGVGGGGSAGEDRVVTTQFPEELGQFHPRDELFINGQLRQWNISDQGIHASVQGQHIYGVMAD